MRFTTGGDSNGSGFCGFITVPFARLVEVFGEPEESDGYKVSAEWVITFEDGTVATVYDWKATNLYEDYLPSPKTLRGMNYDQWHVGGFDSRAVDLVRQALDVAPALALKAG